MRMRRGARAAAASAFPVAVFVAATLIGAQAAGAAPAPKPPPGDNGDVKIHKVGTPYDDQRNEPKVCEFYIDAFNFDPNATLDWVLREGPGFKGDPVLEGHFDVDDNGDGHSKNLNTDHKLDGQYKLEVTFEGQKAHDEKHKVFKIDCSEEDSGGTGGEDNGGGGDQGGGDDQGTGGDDQGTAGAETPNGSGAPDDSGVGDAHNPAPADDSGPAATGAVDAGGGGMAGATAIPGVLLGGSLLTAGGFALRRARNRG